MKSPCLKSKKIVNEGKMVLETNHEEACFCDSSGKGRGRRGAGSISFPALMLLLHLWLFDRRTQALHIFTWRLRVGTLLFSQL